MMRRIHLLIFLIAFAWHNVNAQEQTLGIFLNDSVAYNGYTLFAPTNYDHVYLIDNCGYKVHEWECANYPNHMAYLLEDGSLIRTGKVSSPYFNAGGTCGVIDCYSWDGELLWEFEYNAQLYHQHHDIAPMPNGNVLFIAWNKYPASEAIANGKDPEMLHKSVWMDRILEYDPTANAIVWEWNSWDHLVQDFDETKLNYGVVADHPEKIDINYNEASYPGGTVDWMHSNGIDYNAELDQIIISVRNYSEVWIIDHSTTTEEAAGSTGGNYGKGGDILYRWGNPEAYGRGNENDKMLDAMHDPIWIPDTLPDGKGIMVFNNKYTDFQSAVVVFGPPSDSPGFYTEPGNDAYGPEDYSWKYTEDGFFSPAVSGAQRLPNGNTLICNGNQGYFFEVTHDDKDKVWEYQSPVSVFGPLSQGSNPSDIQQFKIRRYGPEYAAFEGRDLTPGDPVELDPWAYDCTIYNDSAITTLINDVPLAGDLIIVNPFRDVLSFHSEDIKDAFIRVLNLQGMTLYEDRLSSGRHSINTQSWPAGMYVLQVIVPGKALRSYKVIRIS